MFPCRFLCTAYVKPKENSGIVFAIRKESSLFPSADKRSSLSYQVVAVAIEMVYLYVFFLFFPLGIYLWLFSSNRCSSKTSIRIRQLWKYLWAEKCRVGSNTKQWHGPHPSEVSRLWLNGEHCGNLKGEGASSFSYCYKDNILLKIIFICSLLVFFFNCPLESFLVLVYKYIYQETKLGAVLNGLP